ncbi:hypothetical protein ANTRET_LOCUS9811 [Anthophora retusa]
MKANYHGLQIGNDCYSTGNKQNTSLNLPLIFPKRSQYHPCNPKNRFHNSQHTLNSTARALQLKDHFLNNQLYTIQAEKGPQKSCKFESHPNACRAN